MASDKSNDAPKEAIFRLFGDKPTSGLGFLDFPEKPLPPPPPCLEVLLSEVLFFYKHTFVFEQKDTINCLISNQLCTKSKLQVSADAKCSMEPVNVAGLTLLKVSDNSLQYLYLIVNFETQIFGNP